jgi:hypothetical protein
MNSSGGDGDLCYTLVGLIGDGLSGLILVVMVIADQYGIPYGLSDFEGRIAVSFYTVGENCWNYTTIQTTRWQHSTSGRRPGLPI